MTVNLTTGSPFKRVLYLGLPMLVGNFCQLLYNLTDTLILGWYVGPNAIASVGIGFPIIFLVISITIGLCMGSSIMVAQYFGAGKFKEVKSVVGTVTLIMVIVTILTTVIGIAITSPTLKLLKTPIEIFDDAKIYLHIMFGGFVFIVYYNVYTGFLRGLGNSLTPLYFLVLSSVVNVILDLLFIGCLGFGVAGAGIATVIAEGVASVVCIYYVYKRVPMLAVKFKDMKFHKELVRPIMHFSIPPAIQQGLVSFGIVAVQGLVNSFGVSMVAAYVIASRIDSLVMMISMNFSAALSSFVAQNIGAGMVERARKGYKDILLFVSGVSVALGLLIYINPAGIISIFIAYDEEVFRLASAYLSVVPLFYVVMGVLFLTLGILRGAGDTIFPMIITIVSMTVQLFTAYAMAYPNMIETLLTDNHLSLLAKGIDFLPDLGVSAIWYAIAIAWSVAAALSVFRYLSNGWLKYAIVKVKVKNSANEISAE